MGDREETQRTRKVRVEWGPTGPVVDHLTATEAKAVLRQTLLDARASERLRSSLASMVVALVHRDAMRGILGPDGQPVTPMSTTIPKVSADIALRPDWSLRVEPTADGSILVVVEPGTPETPAARVTL